MPKWKPMSDEVFERQFAEATERGRKAQESQARVVSARFDASSRRVVLDLSSNTSFIFPVDQCQGLKGARDEDLEAMVLFPSGLAIEWPALDVQIGLAALFKGIFGGEGWMKQLRAELGRQGGLVQSEAKARAARENGKKGGRPRKTAIAEVSARTAAREPRKPGPWANQLHYKEGIDAPLSDDEAATIDETP